MLRNSRGGVGMRTREPQTGRRYTASGRSGDGVRGGKKKKKTWDVADAFVRGEDATLLVNGRLFLRCHLMHLLLSLCSQTQHHASFLQQRFSASFFLCGGQLPVPTVPIVQPIPLPTSMARAWRTNSDNTNKERRR